MQVLNLEVREFALQLHMHPLSPVVHNEDFVL